MKPFSGSYRPHDVTFLLKIVDIIPTTIAEKEKLIQAGTHYSELISEEASPTDEYNQLFHMALLGAGWKMAQHIASLALTMAHRTEREIVIVSLARAGTPVGVLINRALGAVGRRSVHYSVSIIRERGIDWQALDYICAHHSDRDIVFVDGWTGKGGISEELQSSVSEYNRSRSTNIDPSLWVLADLAGAAAVAATCEDYLIPHAVLNATVSGLIGRTVLNSCYVQPGDFHACAFFQEKRNEDLTLHYVDTLTPYVYDAIPMSSPIQWTESQCLSLSETSHRFVKGITLQYGTKPSLVKPGIGESTRAMLRRIPERLLVQSRSAASVQHLLYLAEAKQAVVEEVSAMPYQAAVIIKPVSK